MKPSIQWNPHVKLILSDVDETVADLYVRAAPEMIVELEKLLRAGKIIFFISGQGLKSIQWRIIDYLPVSLRHKILVAHCSGAEVWGYQPDGTLKEHPYYSVYEKKISEHKKKEWRILIQDIISAFHLETFPTMPVPEFERQTEKNPLAVMYEDRGPQITFEMVNSFDLTQGQAEKLTREVPLYKKNRDLRIPILEYAQKRFEKAGIPITPRLGGVFALDFAVEGISKTTSVEYILSNQHILKDMGISSHDGINPEHLEIWGDKFSAITGGTDRHMSLAVDPTVRSIDFREENPAEFPQGYNIVVWDGKKHLHEGLLEYLQFSF